MKKWSLLSVVIILIFSCKTKVTSSTILPNPEPTSAYKQQIENINKGIYFRGVGNEPEWELKISEKSIEFNSLIPGFEKLIANHVEPIRAMDANVKMYKVVFGDVLATIQLNHHECTNTMSGEKSPYNVRIEFSMNNKTTTINGCGNYITDTRLHDIWVLEQINGKKVALPDFVKELPNLEINTSSNQFMGYAGCNRMNGVIFFERGLLRFSQVISTRKACITPNREDEFLKLLQSTTRYSVENLRLTLTNPFGGELVFKKVD